MRNDRTHFLRFDGSHGRFLGNRLQSYDPASERLGRVLFVRFLCFSSKLEFLRLQHLDNRIRTGFKTTATVFEGHDYIIGSRRRLVLPRGFLSRSAYSLACHSAQPPRPAKRSIDFYQYVLCLEKTSSPSSRRRRRMDQIWYILTCKFGACYNLVSRVRSLRTTRIGGNRIAPESGGILCTAMGRSHGTKTLSIGESVEQKTALEKELCDNLGHFAHFFCELVT